MSTTTLTIISKTVEEAQRVIDSYKGYFDEVLVQINGEKAPKDHDNVRYTGFEWCNDFSAARNELLDQVETTYWFWIDTDDTISAPEKIKDLVAMADKMELDAIYLPYDYQRNQYGELEAYQWRERLLRTEHPWRWIGVVHETPISSGAPASAKNDEIVIQHKLKTQEEVDASASRNHTILLKAYKEAKQKDPRIIFYLAGSFMHRGEDKEAEEKYLEYIKVSGWDEEKHRAWCNIALMRLRNDNPSGAISACMAALQLLPEWPEPYLTIAQTYYIMEDYGKCLSWLKIGLAKPEPDTIMITAPSKRVIAMLTGAMSELYLGHINDAFDLYMMAAKTSPDNEEVKKYGQFIEQAYYENKAIESAIELSEYEAQAGGNVQKLLSSLPSSVANDIRLMPTRQKYLPKKVWPEKSIVFYCGQAMEPWGPDYLEGGMGGSEEAIVYLSRELAKQGWEVTVYNDRDEAYDDNGVTYLPWSSMNPADEFNVFVAWRAPENARGITAKKTLVDLHDAIQPERIYATADIVDKFMVKSKYHRDLYPGIPDKKFGIVSNGIVRSQFK